MRKIYDPTSGSDVTTAVQASISSTRSLFTRWLFRFQSVDFWGYNPYLDNATFSFSNDFPIFVNKAQIGATGATQLGRYSQGSLVVAGETFIPTQMQIEKLEYSIGFEDHPVDVTWYIDDAVDYKADLNQGLSACQSPANMTLKKAFLMSAFNEVPFWIYQALFSDDPAKGGLFYGTVLMFRGYIRKVTETRNGIVLSLASLMDVFQQVQIPTQTIMPNCRAVPYIPGAGGTYAGDYFAITAINNPTSITFQINIINNATVPENALRDYWMNFCGATFAGQQAWGSGQPSAPSWRIRGNTFCNNANSITVFFYEAPIIPVNPGSINIYGQFSLSTKPQGFPYVPPPEYNI